MQLGEQLIAPHGFESLAADVVYHYLYNDANRNRVLLLTFGAPPTEGESAHKKQRRTVLLYLRRDRFEEAVRSALIRPYPTPRVLPHWLGQVTVADLLEHDQRDYKRRIPHTQRIDCLLAHLWPAIDALASVLGAENPEAALNRYARACTPPQNESRYRTAFFTYVAFRMERLALHYAINQIGKWARAPKDKKFGRPSSLGAWHGHSSCDDEMQNMCIQGFRDYATAGQSLRAIYRRTMVRVFGCKPISGERGRMSFVHPEGKPFPTLGQFMYRVAQVYDLETRQLLKYGSARVRSRIAPSKGSFTAAVAYAMEIIQSDGYFIEEVCAGYLEGSHLPRICVVRIVCVSTGMVVGIGFSMKGETAEAYRFAKFCMAVDKVWYCGLFGIRITPDEWPSIGLPLHEVTDRGPGATRAAQSEDASLQPIIKELAPSYSGQSKATVETRHPKSVKQEGAPHYKVTRQSVVEVVRREIWRVIESNKATNVAARLGSDAIAANVLPTPIGMWNYLVDLGRTFSYEIQREQAMRSYLQKVDLTVSDGAVHFMGFRFWSQALRDSKLLELTTTQIQGYLLPACVRHIFLSTPDGILTVDASFGIRVGGEEHSLSLGELEQLSQLRAKEQAALRVHREAAKADVAERFEAETGVPYEHATLRQGRAKRGNTASLEEARQVLPLLRVKRSGS